MNYLITHTDGTAFLTLSDQQTNTTACSLTLIGRGVANYGGQIAESFVKLLENFAATSAPANPIEGQIWWDKAHQTLRVYDNAGVWENVGLGGRLQGADGAVSPATLAVSGSNVGFLNINPNAPANSTRFRTTVHDDGSWALEALYDNGTLKSIPLAVDRNGALTTLIPVSGEAATATRLGAAVAIGLSGDAQGSVQFDGSTNVAIPVTLSPSGVVPGTYLSVVVDGKGRVIQGGGLGLGAIRISGDMIGVGSDVINVSLTSTGVAIGNNGTGTYSGVVVDGKGRVLDGFGLRATGEVTGLASGTQIALSLAPIPGLLAGTYSAVVVNSAGRVVQGLTLQQAQVSTALGFTPVNRAGDTMTGSLAIATSTNDASLRLDGGDTVRRVLRLSKSGTTRFEIGIGPTSEPGDGTGSNLVITPFGDSGTALSPALTIARASGAISVTGTFSAASDMVVGGTIYGNVTGSLQGNASTATRLMAPRAITLAGDVSGSATFDGSNAPTIQAVLAPQPGVSVGVTYSNVTVNAKGIVTSGTTGTAVPVPGALGSYCLYSGGGTFAVGQILDASLVGQSAGSYTCMSSTSIAGSQLYLLARSS